MKTNSAALTLGLSLLALPAWTSAQMVARGAAGADAAAILDTVNQFRADLGGANNGANAHAGSDGRREINWDGVPNAFAAPLTLPGNFFNQNSQRGLQLVATAGVTGYMVSDAATGGNGAGLRFDNLNPTYSATFSTFSPQKLFTSLGSNVYDVIFFVPLTGPAQPGGTQALVSGFGSVFADVDMPGVTSLAFYDIHEQLLGSFTAPVASSGLSFVGASMADGTAQIARVRFTLGNAAIGPDDNGSNFDIVVADDFIYGEPVAASVPEPASVVLWGLGGLGLLLRRCRQRRT